MSKVLISHINSLRKQLKDAFEEGKLDAVTYNSMMLDVNAINDVVDTNKQNEI